MRFLPRWNSYCLTGVSCSSSTHADIQPFFKFSLLKLYSVALIPSHSEQRLQTKWRNEFPAIFYTHFKYKLLSVCVMLYSPCPGTLSNTVVEAAVGGRGFNPMTSLSALMDICEEREGMMSLFPRGFVEGEVNRTLRSYLCVSLCVFVFVCGVSCSRTTVKGGAECDLVPSCVKEREWMLWFGCVNWIHANGNTKKTPDNDENGRKYTSILREKELCTEQKNLVSVPGVFCKS